MQNEKYAKYNTKKIDAKSIAIHFPPKKKCRHDSQHLYDLYTTKHIAISFCKSLKLFNCLIFFYVSQQKCVDNQFSCRNL